MDYSKAQPWIEMDVAIRMGMGVGVDRGAGIWYRPWYAQRHGNGHGRWVGTGGRGHDTTHGHSYEYGKDRRHGWIWTCVWATWG